MRRRTGSVLAAVGLCALTTVAVACGRVPHGAASGGSSAPGATTMPAASAPISTLASTVSPIATAEQPAAASDQQTGTALAAVDSDTQAVDEAADQSDADFNAGVTAEAQNDQP